MNSNPTFRYSYLAFASGAQPFLRADDVGYVITEFMWFRGRPFYPIGALMEARLACTRLSEGHFEEVDQDNLDLIFRMREADGGHFFEIVLRSNRGTAYGGWLWGRNLEMLDEFIDGHRVLETVYDGGKLRFEYARDHGRYRPKDPLPFDKMAISISGGQPQILAADASSEASR